jgi:glutamate-1-semialdehyde aminotransferase
MPVAAGTGCVGPLAASEKRHAGMRRLQRFSFHIARTSSAREIEEATALQRGDECGDESLSAAAARPAPELLLTPWSARVRRLLAERAPLSTAKNAAGYPHLAIDPPCPHPLDPAPVLYARALGAKMWDIDGNEYLDFNNAFGPHLLGYNHPEVMQAIRKEMETAGLHYNFPYTRDKQSQLAEILVGASPAVDKVCFFNSGSDATAMALRAARAHTGKPKLGIFDGAYHGTHDYSMVAFDPSRPASDLQPPTVFTSDGIPVSVLEGVSVLPYNTAEAFERIRAQKHQLAVVMVQAVQASNPRMGMGPWLRELAAVCRECGVLLAFDEIVTGFRMAWGGGHVYYDVLPDLVCYGKVIGGGMPIGAVGGRAAVMERFAHALNGLFPVADDGVARRVRAARAEQKWQGRDVAAATPGEVARAGLANVQGVFGAIGTFNASPLSLAAGVAALNVLWQRKDAVYPWLERTNARIARSINTWCVSAEPPYEASVVFGGGAYHLRVHNYHDQNSGLTEISLRVEMPRVY